MGNASCSLARSEARCMCCTRRSAIDSHCEGMPPSVEMVVGVTVEYDPLACLPDPDLMGLAMLLEFPGLRQFEVQAG